MATKPKKLSITRATEVVELVTNLGLMADHTTAEAELVRLQKTERPDRLNSSTEVREAAKRVRQIEQQFQESVVLVKLEALGRPRWNELADKHPARENNDADERFEINTDTFFDDAIPESIVSAQWKTTGDPVDLDADDWAQLAQEISDVQYAQFITAVLKINQIETSVPFSRSASAVTPS